MTGQWLNESAQVRGRTGYRSSLPSLWQITKAPSLSNSHSVLEGLYLWTSEIPQTPLILKPGVDKCSQETTYKTNSNGKFSFLLKSSLMKSKNPCQKITTIMIIITTKGSSSGLALGPLHLSVLPYFPGEGCQVPALIAMPSLSGILGWAGEGTSQSHSSNSQLWCSPWGAQQAGVGQTGTPAQAGKAIKRSLIACSLSPLHQANARTDLAMGEILDILFGRS